MIEKRFQIDDEGDITEFKSDGKWIDCWQYANGKHWESLCDKLNHLYEENEQIQIEKDTLNKQHTYELTKKLEYKSKLIDLKKENEQLKQQNEHLFRQIKAFRDDCITYGNFNGVNTLNELLNNLEDSKELFE